MKHRQVRQSTWETNSSSTHAYTLYFPERVSVEFKPIPDGNPIFVSSGWYTGTSWRSKAGYVAAYLYIKDRLDDIRKLEELLTNFCGGEVKFDLTKLVEYVDKYPKDKNVEDMFDSFTLRNYDQYGSSPENLEKTFERILATNDNTLAFICSSQGIEINEYYDG